MHRSLLRTWALLGLASLAVLFVAFLTGRDFVRDVYPECTTSLTVMSKPPSGFEPTEAVYLDVASPDAPGFHRLFDEKLDRYSRQYSNVRISWRSSARDGSPCSCGSVPVYLSGESPYDLRLYRDPVRDLYVVKGRMDYGAAYTTEDSSVRSYFFLKPGAARHFQRDRVFTMHHLPAMVSLLAIGALVVGLLRSRRATSYARRLHAWTEARVTIGGVIESEHGAQLGTLEQLQGSGATPGPILVAPEAIAAGALYRDMPLVRRRDIAEGSHALWTHGTMRRLRDARAMAILSTACTMLAFGARLIA